MDLVEPRQELPTWTFLTNHAHVLIAIQRNPELRQRDISHAVGITIGAVQRIIDDLEKGGYVTRARVGRRNTYKIEPDRPLRHPLENNHTVDELLNTLKA
ncbi:MAG: helix-turn-helix domain-containing protein [Acidimicrobiales bacterium]